jgi:hypothetical protein
MLKNTSMQKEIPRMVINTSIKNHSSDGDEHLKEKIIPLMVMNNSMQKSFL